MTQTSRPLKFNYIISAAPTSYLGIKVNGTPVVTNLSGNQSWGTYNQTVEPIDGKITISLSYSKGVAAANNDLAAIKNLNIGSQSLQPTTNYANLTLSSLGEKTYVYGRAKSKTNTDVMGMSGAFVTTINPAATYRQWSAAGASAVRTRAK